MRSYFVAGETNSRGPAVSAGAPPKHWSTTEPPPLGNSVEAVKPNALQRHRPCVSPERAILFWCDTRLAAAGWGDSNSTSLVLPTCCQEAIGAATWIPMNVRAIYHGDNQMG